MEPQLLDFSTCVEMPKPSIGNICPYFDATCGNCGRCEGLCRVYEKYLLKKGTAYDLLEFWANRRSIGKGFTCNPRGT